MDTAGDAAARLARLAMRLARRIPLGAQAYVALETAEVLRRHGLKGVYGLLLRKEFLAAADLLCRVLGIDGGSWPLGVHELSAAIFYALAQHRALRGLRPEGEEVIHSLASRGAEDGGEGGKVGVSGRAATLAAVRESAEEDDEYDGIGGDNQDDEAGDTIVWEGRSPLKQDVAGEFAESVLDETDVYDPSSEKVVDVLAMSASTEVGAANKRLKGDGIRSRGKEKIHPGENDPGAATTRARAARLPFDPVCDRVPDSLVSSLLFYAPLALDFIYAECEVDMQLLAAQQGWRLAYASLDQDHDRPGGDDGGTRRPGGDGGFSDRPASALFAHDERRIACLSVRGTATIHDVVTDIRAMPVPFPQEEEEGVGATAGGGDPRRGGNGGPPVPDPAARSPDGFDEEWTSVFRGNGLALCGMAGAASNLFRETADSLLYLALNGYKIRIVVSARA